MILEQEITAEDTEEIQPLNAIHEEALFDLVTLVQPGYFSKGTSSLGSYFGIFKHGMLVAVTGERMKMDGFTEISAVVTHPQHTGNGYAKQLIACTANKIFAEGKLPYLHVAAKNTAAIYVYDKLGFTTRRKISFWQFGRATA